MRCNCVILKTIFFFRKVCSSSWRRFRIFVLKSNFILNTKKCFLRRKYKHISYVGVSCTYLAEGLCLDYTVLGSSHRLLMQLSSHQRSSLKRKSPTNLHMSTNPYCTTKSLKFRTKNSYLDIM